jgi:hypothetical protein
LIGVIVCRKRCIAVDVVVSQEPYLSLNQIKTK